MTSVEEEEITYTGFTPYLHQRDVINELLEPKKGKIVAVKSSRQKGKSLLVENMLLYYGINFKLTSICVSPTLAQARKVFQDVQKAIDGADLINRCNETLLEIYLKTGSKILFKSAEQGDNLRGYTVTGLLAIDESAFIPDEVFYKIIQWTDVYKANILMVSSPYMKEGFFWNYFNRGTKGNANIIAIDWSDKKYEADMAKLLPPDRLEEYRQTIPSAQFRSEYLGEFLDDDGTVFSGFRECQEDHEILPTDRLYVGIDWANGGGNDDTVISIINQSGQQVLLAYWNNLSPSEQIDRIVDILEPLQKQIVQVRPELNSVGTPYTDMLKNRLHILNIKGFTTTNKSKNDIVAQLQVAFERREITILPDSQQMKELGAYTVDFNPKTKIITYNAPSGMHDDICIALMLSYDAYLNASKRGTYSISVARR